MSWTEFPQSEYKITNFLGKLLCLSQFLYFAYVNYPIFTQYDMENDRYGRKSSF